MQIISIIAIFLGPLIAVIISIKLNQYYLKKNSDQQIKINIFYTLMQNREFPFSSQFYIALNSINVAFYNNKDVIHAWKEFRNYIASNPEKDKIISNNEDLKWNTEKKEHFYNLLKKMAKDLNYEFNEDDIKNTSYIPPEVIESYKLNNITINELISKLSEFIGNALMKSNSETEQHRSKLND
ncbi:MAG: hypothetical protein EVJ48_01515 [Candidatus Acidulodesulfobacterium acidiphilum]|uniref:DUF6680 domain-containing protein n=1 Tax=Candidatus Acidulodesulfobacterium acidiphilum TaxID=2597224 RepID=A0A520XGG0_9DELT|nr:MAG: hypothetical protein EVJ48_01515 [Candidatus Acidulodesulfobacterium acidiphilum]